MKQIKFLDKENDVIHGGILTDEGNVICACCGGILEKDMFEGDDPECVILETYNYWVDFSFAIID